MKKKNLIYVAIIVALGSCTKSDTTTVVTPTVPASNPISAGNISGFVKGTMITGNTYTITGDLNIKPGDTLACQQGVTVIVKNNSQINIAGVLELVGTPTQPISFNSDTKTPGSWGGFQCDSAQAVTIKWVHVDNTGGPDPTGGARKTVFVNVPIHVDIEDSWFTNGQDDLIRIQAGATISILRNTILSSGSTDGEAINIKSGVTGTIAYNVVFSQAGTGIKLETNDLQPVPQTSVDVYNNTLVSNGWRRGSAEPGRGVSVGLNAKANIYNNIMVNNYEGLVLFADGDTINTHYGNNLFYASADAYVDTTQGQHLSVNIRANFYPSSEGVGKPQSTDLISTSTTTGNPMFVSFDGTIAAPNGAPTSNNYHLQAGSPALGKGNTEWSADIGAYTSDANKSNLH